MHVLPHLVPGHHIAGAVGAEHRVGGIVQIPLGVIMGGGDDVGGIAAGPVTVGGQGDPAPAVGVARQLPGIAPQAADRGRALQDGGLPLLVGGAKGALHLLDVVHGPAQVLGRQLQPEVVPGFQQDVLGHHQALAHRPPGRLAEIAALGVLQVGPARNQGDFHVGEGGAGENPPVLLFFQVGNHQPLPVPGQHFFPAVDVVLDAAAGGQGLHLQVHLGIVAQGLIVAYPLHRLGNRFLI